MKKFLLQIMFLMLMLPGMSQAVVYINGTITDSANGYPISNHAVTIVSDSTYGFIYYNVVYTNSSGFYSDTVPVVSGSSGILYIQIFDCNNYLHQATVNFAPANLNFIQDFQICNSNSPCQADFTYYPDSSDFHLIQFIDLSVGNIISWEWAFNDPTSGINNSSNLQNPTHYFAGTGPYNVCLTVQGADSSCYDITCKVIIVGNTAGCQADFGYYVSGYLTVQFNDYSTGGNGPWSWNFGDNGTSTLQNPSHSYSNPGQYLVTLAYGNPNDTCYDIKSMTIYLNDSTGGGCHAAFLTFPDSINNPPYTYNFIDQSSGNIATWIWNFGDGLYQTITYPANPDVTHTYSQPGYYLVCLSIQGVDSTCYDYTCDTIIVGSNTGCQADFTYSPDSSNMIQFTDQSTGNIIYWSWDFGDPGSGLNNNSTVQNPVHMFSAPGTYNVCLTIQGADSSCYDITCKTVIVGNNQGCQAMFTYINNPAYGAYAIQFTDQSTGNPSGWMWNFGDSTYSTEQNPLHVYAGPGTFQVCLTITGNNCTSTHCQNVVVEDPQNYHQVYGQVFEGNFPIQMGIAMIFSLDSNLNYNPYIDVCNIDSMGIYYFTLVPDGNYLVYAIPLDYNGYLPTYYGDVLNWEQATVIVLGEPSNPYDIHLIQSGYVPQGPGSVSGQVNMSSIRSSMLDKMTMLLMDEAFHAISFDMVSETGSFDFSTMDYGTYYLYAEMSGITSDYVKVVLTPEKPHADVVMTFAGKNILGINNTHPGMETGVIYPNPAVDRFNLVLNLAEVETVKVEIFNQKGQITSSMTRSFGSGKTVLTLSVSDMTSGIYTLRISSDKGTIITRKLIITK